MKLVTILNGEFNAELITPVINRKRINKPDNWGLWTSPYSKEFISDWIYFLKRNRHRVFMNETPTTVNAYEISIIENANLYVVESEEDWIKLVKKYHIIEPAISEGEYEMTVDYESMSKDFNGLYISNPSATTWIDSDIFYQMYPSIRFAEVPDYVAFDAKSLLIFNKNIINNVEQVQYHCADFPKLVG